MVLGGFLLLTVLSLVSSVASLQTALGLDNPSLLERVLGALLAPLFLAGPFLLLPRLRRKTRAGGDATSRPSSSVSSH